MANADIYQGSSLVGHFDRLSSGYRFQLTEGAKQSTKFLATHLPIDTLETPELPTFFLNLLPEGARLQLLLQSARSREDSLELLLRVGWDTIGDISVVPQGELPGANVRSKKFSEIDFWQTFYEGAEESPDASIPGVQEKISAATVTFSVKTARIPQAMVKLNPNRFPLLVQNEFFFLQMARACGLAVNKAKLVYDRNGEPGLLVTRFDRIREGKQIVKLHQEDACQLLDLVPSHKYQVSMRQIAEAVQQHCVASTVDIERLLRLYIFSYMIGNCDLHAKNISLLWKDDVVKLSPGYDLLSTLPYHELQTRMALPLEGKEDNFRSRDFVEFGQRFGVPKDSTLHVIKDLCSKAEPWLSRFHEIGFEEAVTDKLKKEIAKRMEHLRR
jgi:serine/threonine-protein kinase HipA